MKTILGITNELSQALQRKDQNIENAMRLVKLSNMRLQMMRDDGWPILLEDASEFFRKYHISIPNMDEVYVVKGRSARKSQKKIHVLIIIVSNCLIPLLICNYKS